MRVVSVALAAAFAAVGAAGFIAAAAPARADSTSPIAGYPDFEIVESAPIETTLDHPNIRNATEVWIEMIRGARKTLDFAEFYASSKEGSALDSVIAEIERAADRGVQVRFFCDKRMNVSLPETIERIKKIKGAEFRQIDFGKFMGGVHHAKYFVVDGEDPRNGQAFLGSQNFDWRALEHIQELGVRTRLPSVVGAFSKLLAEDWYWAGAQADTIDMPSSPKAGGGSRAYWIGRPDETGARFNAWPVASPKGFNPEFSDWDEPRLAAMIDSARTSVSVQVLTYKPVSDSVYWDVLESAMRRAAARGVRVRLIASDWCKRRSTIPYLKSLALIPNIEVR